MRVWANKKEFNLSQMVLDEKEEEENRKKRKLKLGERERESFGLKIKANRGALNRLVARGKEWEEKKQRKKAKT